MPLVQRCHGDRAEVQVNTAAGRCIMTTQCMGADVWPLNRKAGEVNKERRRPGWRERERLIARERERRM